MATWQEYLREARRFWDVAEAADDSRHVNQAVSNAIHAVIAANDALCLFFLNRRPAGDSHGEAVRALQRACEGTKWEGESARRSRQLSQILEHKNAAQYLGQPMNPAVADRVMSQAERFLDWVEEVVPPTEIANGSA